MTFYGNSFALFAGIGISFKAELLVLNGDTDLFELLASSVLFVERELFLILSLSVSFLFYVSILKITSFMFSLPIFFPSLSKITLVSPLDHPLNFPSFFFNPS